MDAREMKKAKKNVDILQVAASDKENLSRKIGPKKKFALSNGRIRLGKREGKISGPDNEKAVEMKNNINKVKTENRLKGKVPEIIIATDLTNDAPSEKYWEKLAESRRIALESALKENLDLNNKLNEVEYENTRLKEMLSEAQTLVEVLTEMLEDNRKNENEDENENENENENEENILENTNHIDSGSENESFQSCN